MKWKKPTKIHILKGLVLILCLSSLVTVLVSSLYDGKPSSIRPKRKTLLKTGKIPQTYWDLEPKLCVNNINRRGVLRVNIMCPRNGIVTIMQSGKHENRSKEPTANEIEEDCACSEEHDYGENIPEFRSCQCSEKITTQTQKIVTKRHTQRQEIVTAKNAQTQGQKMVTTKILKKKNEQEKNNLTTKSPTKKSIVTKKMKSNRHIRGEDYSRLGNEMWSYASVWAVARKTGLDPYIPRCIKNNLDKHFDKLSVPTFEEIEKCPLKFNTFVGSIENWKSTHNQSIILPQYTFHQELVSAGILDIAQEFTFKQKLRDDVENILLNVTERLPRKNYTFVGVHVRRRSDYVGYIKKKYNASQATASFFKNAMAYFKYEYTNCFFIFVSDDPIWCQKFFGQREDVMVPGFTAENTPELDLAILASCNHTIFDYGRFGEWGSILAGGQTVYYNNSIPSEVATSMKNWISMN